MNTDRELLEAAAKAAGIEWCYNDEQGNLYEIRHDLQRLEAWNPLTDERDALRLAVKLGMRVYIYPGNGDDGTIVASDELNEVKAWHRTEHGDDPCGATMRAIVNVAAQIGKAKEDK